MSLYKRGNVWWMDFAVRGIRVHESTSTNNKDLALQVERARRRRLEASVNGIAVPVRPKKFLAAFADWKEANEARWSDSYKTIQTGSLKHLTPTFKLKLLTEITASDIGKYQTKRQKEGAANRTINIEVATLRMLLKSNKLWRNIMDDVHMLSEREDVGKALEREEAARLLQACFVSSQPSLYPAVVIYNNTGLRGAELRRGRWLQVNFDKREYTVGKAKTRGGDGRVIPLNQAAMDAFTAWRARWPDAKPSDFIFPSEKLAFRGKGAGKRGVMTPYGLDLSEPIGSWKTAWNTAKRKASVECRIHDLRHNLLDQPLRDGDLRFDHPRHRRASQPEDAGALQPYSRKGQAHCD